MGLLTLEHSNAAYCADFAISAAAVLALSVGLMAASPRDQGWVLAALALLGLLSWTLIEYALHRFVLHGLQPFRRWHALHHQRPTALIYTPTLLVAALIATLVFLPMLLLGNRWQACALTLGVLIGNLAYALMHHAMHHTLSPRFAQNAWLRQRRHRHALHHRMDRPVYYGVTSAFWDRVFGSTEGRPASVR